MSNFRHPLLLRLASKAPHCFGCGKSNAGDVVAAHSNQGRDGKGAGIKASDAAISYFCATCHHAVDAGRKDQDQAVAFWEAGHRATMRWLVERDPEGEAICVLGVRRSESARRSKTPVFEPISINHGGRSLWKPLAEYDDAQRDALLAGAGFDVLPHRSDECEVCIHANRPDLRRISERGIDRVRALEAATGKFMFRPKGYAGAEGIDEVMRWARSERGQYRPLGSEFTGDLFTDGEAKIEGCEDDFCGI